MHYDTAQSKKPGDWTIHTKKKQEDLETDLMGMVSKNNGTSKLSPNISG